MSESGLCPAEPDLRKLTQFTNFSRSRVRWLRDRACVSRLCMTRANSRPNVHTLSIFTGISGVAGAVGARSQVRKSRGAGCTQCMTAMFRRLPSLSRRWLRVPEVTELAGLRISNALLRVRSAAGSEAKLTSQLRLSHDWSADDNLTVIEASARQIDPGTGHPSGFSRSIRSGSRGSGQ
jgi:hypothetical protein